MKDMLTNHSKDVSEFQREARYGKADVKNLASETANTIQDHVKQAKSIESASAHAHRASSGASSGTHGFPHKWLLAWGFYPAPILICRERLHTQ